MNIEDIIESLENYTTPCSDIAVKLGQIREHINQLEADKLELSKAIVVYENKSDVYCCDDIAFKGNHNVNCIVNKANKYIKEVEK